MDASPLIAYFDESPPIPPEGIAAIDYAHRIAAHARIEHYTDDIAPPCASGRARGGSGVFRSQSLCPFRGFAEYRLSAKALDTPGPGLSAAERGTAVHRILERLWSDLGSRQALLALTDVEIEQRVRGVVAAVMADLSVRKPLTLKTRFHDLECARLRRLIRDWLRIEANRLDFTLAGHEARHELTVGGLSTSIRVDRVDRLADGRYVVIDYKTGKVSPSEWFGERPAEPQLPLYSLLYEPLAALAFARVAVKDAGFSAVATDDGMLPGIEAWVDGKRGREIGDWDELLAGWRRTLEAIARDFLAGKSSVDPLRYPQTCENCALPSLCRIQQKMSP